MTDYQSILNDIHNEVRAAPAEGRIADYIPELARVSPDHFGMHLLTVDEEQFNVGENQQTFSIQSISKVLSLAHALPMLGERLWDRIGVEPSGNPFNSIVQLEYERGIPRNPFINSGAIVTADILITNLDHPKEEFLTFVRTLAGNPHINYNERVAKSEMDNGFGNAALANMLKKFGNIENGVEEVLDFYFHQCSIEMSCRDLARAFLPFANQGQLFHFHNTVLTRSQVKRLNALMLTCGFYDEAGEFAFKVGLPGKSGVGGGIVAVHPEYYSVAVWSPLLNEKGNSVLGMKALEMLTTETGFSIF